MAIKQQLQKSAHLIEKSNYILIIPAQPPNKNAIDITLAVFSFLQNAGKKADILSVAKNTAFNKYPAVSNIADERAFIIKINTKEKPPNQLKYEADKGQIKIIIDSETQNFSPGDVSFEYTPFKYDLVVAACFKNLESLGNIFTRNRDFFAQTPIVNIGDSPAAVFANKDFSW